MVIDMYEKTEKIVGYVMILIMCISLIPVMYLGRYNHPTGDDYYYGVETRQVIEDGGNIAEVLAEAVKGVARQYVNWQGTYSAMFLMHLPPNVFGEGFYGLVTTAMILLFVVGTFYFLKQVVCLWMRGTRYLWMILSSVYVLLCLETVPFIGESIFWYNGSIYYTGYYAITMFFLGLIVRYLYCPKKYHMPVLAFLALFLAGGNYVSLLPCIILLATLTAVLIFKRSKKSIGIGSLVVLMLIGLFISAAAPGNQIRQEGLFEMSAVKAVLKSILQGLRYVEGWTSIWWLLAIVLLTPFMWHSYEHKRIAFRYPIIVLGYMFGIFCSMGCPTFYAMNTTGPARVLAIVYYGFMAFMLFSYYYLLGYFYDLFKRKGKTLNLKFIPQVISVLFVFLFVMQIASGKMAECTTLRAFRVLQSGEAEEYQQEYRERLEVLRDDAIQDVVFQPYEHQPDLLYVGDFTGDVQNPNNVRIARYWGKNTIIVDYEE